MEDLNDYQGFTDAINDACRKQRIPADTAVAEYAPGQFEINLKHRTDAVQACDDAVMLKRAIKAVASKQSLLASFMAKPFADQAGSGTHIHVSVLDRDGQNIFACTPEAPAATLKHAVAGLQVGTPGGFARHHAANAADHFIHAHAVSNHGEDERKDHVHDHAGRNRYPNGRPHSGKGRPPGDGGRPGQ